VPVPSPVSVTNPRDWVVPAADVLLADGTIAVIRTLRPDDREAVLDLHENVSQDTLRLRFFTANRNAGRDYVAHLFDDANSKSAALVALIRGRVAGLGTAEVLGDDRAEVAFLVSDQDRGRGLGGLLLEHLAAVGRAHGVTRFEAEVLAENYGMLRVFRGAGFAVSRRSQEGEISVELRTDVSAAALDAADRREWRSEARSLRPLLSPESVAVVGVRRSEGGLGRAVLNAISDGSYAGRLSVVHPAAEAENYVVAGLPAYPSVSAIPDPVDLVVVVVPPDQVADVMADACAAGVGAAIIVSSGFAGDGQPLGRGLLELARAHSVRVVGPNSQGVLSHGTSTLNTTFARALPEPGGLAIATQSGGVGFTLLDLARDLGVGVHSFVSLGAKLDVSSNDVLAAWGEDAHVTVAGLHLESFGNALKFARTARRFAERKPLLAVVGGRGVGRGNVGVDALFAQAGVIACRSAAELTETAAVLIQQPLPAGYRVAVVTNAGGMGVLTADLARGEGLAVPVLTPELREALGDAAPSISTRNPVDLGADVSPESVEATVRRMLHTDEVDALVVVLVPTSLADPLGLLEATRAASASAGKPVLVVASDIASHPKMDGLTVLRTPEAAVGALARAMRYASWRSVPADELAPGVLARATAARELASSRLVAGRGRAEWLPGDTAAELLAPYGITLVGVAAHGRDGARKAAREVGFPVVVKVADTDVLHKTDRGLVRVGLTSGDEVAAAVAEFAAELGTPEGEVAVLVQPVVDGVEVSCSVLRDDTFGPLVRVASGGIASDLLHDEVHLLPPVAPSDAAKALRGLRLWPLLDGFRGTPRVDVDALEALVLAVAQLAVDVPQLGRLDLNPVFARADGVHCVDVKVLLAPAEALDAGIPRRLRPLS
jgi:acyl-CoA synthetase (NDP forming)/GNAT superfamily N-acetyltransferase